MGVREGLGDDELVDLVRRGDDDAFARLAQRYRSVIEAACASVIFDPHFREDAVQTALIDIWKGVGGFKGDAGLSSWIYRVSRNAAVRSATRRKGRLESPTMVNELMPPHHDGFDDASATHAIVIAALEKMPEAQRNALLLHTQAGLPIREIAEVLSAAEGTVKSWIHRARNDVADRLQQCGEGPIRS